MTEATYEHDVSNHSDKHQTNLLIDNSVRVQVLYDQRLVSGRLLVAAEPSLNDYVDVYKNLCEHRQEVLDHHASS